MKFANHYFQFIFTFYPTAQLVGLGVVMLWCKTVLLFNKFSFRRPVTVLQFVCRLLLLWICDVLFCICVILNI